MDVDPTTRTIESLVSKRVSVVARVRIPEVYDEKRLNAWLSFLSPNMMWPNSHAASTRQEAFIRYTLTLMTQLYRLGQIPIFDQPVLQAMTLLEGSSNRYRVKVGTMHLALMSSEMHQLVFSASFQLLTWMIRHEPTRSNKEAVECDIKNRLVIKLRAYLLGGTSTIPVLSAAHELNIPFEHIGLGVYQLGWGSKSRLLYRSVSDGDAVIGAVLAQHKFAAAHYLRSAGLPAPRHHLVCTLSEAVLAAQKLAWPLVVKPLASERGEGVSVDVMHQDALATAVEFAQAKSKAKEVLVESQVPGVCHRLFIVNDQLLYAVKRNPMSVRGDGVRTIRQLVDDTLDAEQHLPIWRRSKLRPIDDLALHALGLAGLTPDSVMPTGVLAPLRRIESTEWGGVDDNMTGLVHPDNEALAIRAANLFGLDVAGIDMITTDISKPWYQNGAIINEINYSPLLGGAEISRSYLPKFFKAFMGGDGRIPVEVFSDPGDALNRQMFYVDRGLRCFYTSGIETRDPRHYPVPLDLNGVQPRLRALIKRKDVDAIVVYGLV